MVCEISTEKRSFKPMTVDTVGIEVPADFPLEAYDEFHKKIAPLQPKYPEAYKHYAGGWNAVAYRFASCAEYDAEFTKSIQTSTVPTERYVQERSLFGFFMSAIAVLDSGAYALYAVANMIAAARFPLSDLQRISLQFVATAFTQQFASDKITSVLKQICDQDQMKQLRQIRNILAHRAATTRSFGGDWSPTGTWQLQHQQLPSGVEKIDIDKTITSTMRTALSAQVAVLTKAAVDFAKTHF
jgi:hypothetical protein